MMKTQKQIIKQGPDIELRVIEKEEVLQYQCGICLELLSYPVCCVNKHYFCENCLRRALRSSEVCPKCRVNVRAEALVVDDGVMRGMGSMIVRCQYGFSFDAELNAFVDDDEGCSFQGAYCDIVKHERACQYRWVWCRFSDACGCFRFFSLSAHEKSCPNSVVRCKYCSAYVKKGELHAHHVAVCDNYTVKCRYCDLEMDRCWLREHLAEACLVCFGFC